MDRSNIFVSNKNTEFKGFSTDQAITNMLHIISESLLEPAVLQRYLTRIGHGHNLLLIEDAVFAAQPDCTVANMLASIMTQSQVFVLSEDILARGIKPNEPEDGIKQVDYAGFVDLVAEHKRVQLW